MQLILKETYLKILTTIFAQFNLNFYIDKIPDHGVFTNLSCILDPQTQYVNLEQCNLAEDLQITDCLNMDYDLMEDQIKNLINNWTKALPQVFKYEYFVDMDNFTASATPICVKTESQFPNYTEFVESSFLDDEIRILFNPNLKLSLGLDANENYEITSLSARKSVDSSNEHSLIELTKSLSIFKDSLWTGAIISNPLSPMKQKIQVGPLSDCTDEQHNSEEVFKYKENQHNHTQESSKKICHQTIP